MDISIMLRTLFLSSLYAIAALLLLLLLAHVVPYFLDKRCLRSYRGLLLARLSDVWLSVNTGRGKLNRIIHDAHKAYGPVIRIAPNHISIADPSALQAIYGHGSGIIKSDFYDVFQSFNGRRAIFSARSREEHSRKRKLISHTFSQKTTLEFEPVVRQYIGGVIKQWDRMCAAAATGKGGVIGDMVWTANGGRAAFDSLKWYTFMVYDLIGDLVFRAPFGMTERGTDLALVAKRPEDAIPAYGFSGLKLEYDTVNAVSAIEDRTMFTFTIAMLPAPIRELVKKTPLPWFRRGADGYKKFAALAVTACAHRTQYDTNRSDILAKYFEATDEEGNRMDNFEITAEALDLLIAGTDTISNSVAATTFYLAQNRAAQAKLQRELDEVLGAPNTDDTDEPGLASYEEIKNLPYLQDVVNEGLRLFSTAAMGLPREVREEGLTVLGHTFAPGTVVSVPSYVIHRDTKIWGEDAESFNPDRWANGDKAAMAKAFMPFSIGPRACIGRNLAWMELLMVVANVFHRFDVAPAYSGQTMEIRDGFIRKPYASVVSLKRRGNLKQ